MLAPTLTAPPHVPPTSSPTCSPHGLLRVRNRVAAMVLAIVAVATMGACSPPSSGGSSLGLQAVALASQESGRPYVYGAAGPYSFDCSGLVMYVYGRLGRGLGHNTNIQYGQTSHISQAAKQPGDLIFFGYPGNLYHVGIYAGYNRIWHAPSPGQSVQLATIWTSDYYVSRVY